MYSELAGGYILSPAYDITNTINKAEHELTVNGKGLPEESDLVQIAEAFNLSREKTNEIISNIKRVFKFIDQSIIYYRYTFVNL